MIVNVQKVILKIKNKACVFLFIFNLLAVNSFAQKQANIWHFGDSQCLDFSSGAPVVVPGSAMITFEGCASYCDKFGNLLMYTNGGGREPAFSNGDDPGHIWNRNNAVMYDMQGVEGGGWSAVQSSVIFEAPGQDSVYYVFTMEEGEFFSGASPAIQAAQPLGRGLSYFTVDMRLNSGLGGVVLADQRLDTFSYEGLCAIRHANRRDYWVIIHQESMGLGVFSVTPAGVNFIGTYTGAGTPGNSSIKAAPNGEKVVANFSGLPGTTGTLKLLDFDNNTGQLSNPVPLSVPNFINSYEFSPNSRFLYTTQANVSSIPTVESIVRFDLQAPSIVASATTLGNITTGTATPGFQLAPDGKIYFLAVDFSSNTNYINRINCPNTIGATLELNLFTTVSAPRFYLNLPNFPSWLFENDDSTYVSLGPDTVDLCDVGGSYVLSALNPGATYLWSTGDTSQSIVVTTTGTYSVTVTGPCGVGTDQIVVLPCCTSASTGFPTVNASSVSGTCGQSNGTATATATGGSGNYAYTWSNGATDSFISGLSSGSYSVIATDQNGCSSTSQVIVSTSPAAGVTLTAGDTILGINESVTLTIDGGDTYNWSPATGLNCTDCPTVIASPQSSTTYTVTGTDSVGCPYLRVVNVVVDIICGELFVPDIFSPNGIGNSENEKLCVYSNCIKSMNLGIYNRWGELIFSTDNQNDCWDGTHKGVPVMTGVYTYRLFVEQLDGEKIERTGNITLTR